MQGRRADSLIACLYTKLLLDFTGGGIMATDPNPKQEKSHFLQKKESCLEVAFLQNQPICFKKYVFPNEGGCLRKTEGGGL